MKGVGAYFEFEWEWEGVGVGWGWALIRSCVRRHEKHFFLVQDTFPTTSSPGLFP